MVPLARHRVFACKDSSHRSSLALLRSKGPVAAHSGAPGVGGYHPEMVSGV
jgi:hypothetical protein